MWAFCSTLSTVVGASHEWGLCVFFLLLTRVLAQESTRHKFAELM